MNKVLDLVLLLVIAVAVHEFVSNTRNKVPEIIMGDLEIVDLLHVSLKPATSLNSSTFTYSTLYTATPYKLQKGYKRERDVHKHSTS